MKCKVCKKSIPERRLALGKATCSFQCEKRLPENRLKVSMSMKKALSSEEAKKRKSEASKRNFLNPEFKKKTLEALNKPETIAKRNESIKKTYQNPEVRQKLSKIIKSVMTEENRRKISEATSKALSTEEAKFHLSRAQKEVQNRPEIKKRKSECSKERWRNPEYKESTSYKIKQTFADNLEQIKEKENKTKRLNNSFNLSKPETEVKQLLEQKYTNVEHQYRSKKYPFNCDFYVQDLDLYIELHFTWAHGGRPYDLRDSECTKQLNFWKEKAKTSDYYGYAIYVWTDLDVRKRQCAIDNKLNYKSFYNWDQFLQWYNSTSFEKEGSDGLL